MDGYASITNLGTMRRLVYQEGCGAYTTIDFDSDTVLLNRENEWVTQAIFSTIEKSNAQIISEEGRINFNINVKELQVDDNSLKVVYELLDGESYIDTHTFNCVWTEEEEAWLEIH